jgi:hypothetical protein
VLYKARDFNSQEVANTLNALSKYDHYDKAVFDVLCGEVLSKARDFKSQEVANTLHALCTLAHFDRVSFSLLFGSVSEQEVHSWGDEGLSQLSQVKLCLSLERAAWGLSLPPAVDKAAGTSWQHCVSRAESSRLHLEVSEALGRLGVLHRNEAIVGGLSVDILLEDGGGAGVVVEVDGPSHYCKGSGHSNPRELGPTRFKRRLLQLQGWRVHNLPHFEWRALRGNRQAQQDYLSAMLLPDTAPVSATATKKTPAKKTPAKTTPAKNKTPRRRRAPSSPCSRGTKGN